MPAPRRRLILAAMVLLGLGATAAQAGPGGAACGSRGLAACPAGQFCDYGALANCGASDRPGTCRPRPEMCIAIYEPVCGCDGQTYGNDCDRQAAGTGLRQTGACR